MSALLYLSVAMRKKKIISRCLTDPGIIKLDILKQKIQMFSKLISKAIQC